MRRCGAEVIGLLANINAALLEGVAVYGNRPSGVMLDGETSPRSSTRSAGVASGAGWPTQGARRRLCPPQRYGAGIPARARSLLNVADAT